MAATFGLKLGIEGEKEFGDDLREINQSFKVLGSEMKLVSSEFDKNDRSGSGSRRPQRGTQERRRLLRRKQSLHPELADTAE